MSLLHDLNGKCSQYPDTNEKKVLISNVDKIIYKESEIPVFVPLDKIA